MVLVCTHKDFDVCKVKVLKPRYINDNTIVFDIKYDNDICLIQTPIATIPYSYSIFDNNAFRLDILCQGSEIYDTLQALSDYVMRKAKRFITVKTVKTLVGAKMLQANSPQSKLTLTNRNVDHIGIFGVRREAIGIEDIHKFDNVICLFEVRRLVVSGDVVFWQTNLLQIKQCSNNTTCNVRKCMIEERPLTSWDASKFDIYGKMHKLGIHIDAIKHKMKLDGLGDDFFEYWFKHKDGDGEKVSTIAQTPAPMSLNILPPRPPPPPPPPPMAGKTGLTLTKSGGGGGGGPLAFLKDISNGNFALRKIEAKLDTTGIEKVKCADFTEFTPPSLEQIQGALMKLKKISLFDK